MEQTRQLANAPLVFVIAAVRFESLEALPTWIPSIQDKLRKILPSFRRMRQTLSPKGLEVAIDPSDFDTANAGSCWLFSTLDHRTVVTLHKSGIMLHTLDYAVFPQFAKLLSSAVDALIGSAEVLNVSQIGIRYVDHIQPQHEMDVRKFIVESLMPQHVLSHLIVQNASSSASYRSVTDTQNAKLNVRFSIGVGESVFPKDLAIAYAVSISGAAMQDGSLELPTLEAGAGVLDMDAVDEELDGVSMSTKEIVDMVDRLHRVANDYFDAVITPDARRAWSTPQ